MLPDGNQSRAAFQHGLQAAAVNPFSLGIACDLSQRFAEPEGRSGEVALLHQPHAVGCLQLNQPIPILVRQSLKPAGLTLLKPDPSDRQQGYDSRRRRAACDEAPVLLQTPEPPQRLPVLE